jgi:hypothetical protein
VKEKNSFMPCYTTLQEKKKPVSWTPVSSATAAAKNYSGDPKEKMWIIFNCP